MDAQKTPTVERVGGVLGGEQIEVTFLARNACEAWGQGRLWVVRRRPASPVGGTVGSLRQRVSLEEFGVECPDFVGEVA